MSIWVKILLSINITAIIYVLLYGYNELVRLTMSLFKIADCADTMRHSSFKLDVSADIMMPVSLILPEYKKETHTVSAIKDLLASEHPELEIIAVCNSEKSDTLKALEEEFSLSQTDITIKRAIPGDAIRAVYRSTICTNLIVLDYTGVDRSGMINAAVDASRYPVFITLKDGEHLAKDALTQISVCFTRSSRIAAAGDLPRVCRNDSSSSLGAIGSLMETDCLRSYPAGLALTGQNKLKLMPGAFNAFRKQTVIDAGGFARGGNGTDMAVRIWRNRIKNKTDADIVLLPEPIICCDRSHTAGTAIAHSMSYSSDLFYTLKKNPGMLLNPRYGRAGLFDIPLYWLFGILGPVIELIGCVAVPLSFAFGIIGLDLLLAFLAAELLLGTVVSLSATAAQELYESNTLSAERTARRTLCSVLYNLGYRQFMLIFRIAGLFKKR